MTFINARNALASLAFTYDVSHAAAELNTADAELAQKDATIKALAEALAMWVGTERGHTIECGSDRDDERSCSAECAAMRPALRLAGVLK